MLKSIDKLLVVFSLILFSVVSTVGAAGSEKELQSFSSSGQTKDAKSPKKNTGTRTSRGESSKRVDAFQDLVTLGLPPVLEDQYLCIIL